VFSNVKSLYKVTVGLKKVHDMLVGGRGNHNKLQVVLNELN